MQVQLSFAGASLTGVLAIPEAALHGRMVRIASAHNRLELRPVTAGFAQDGSVIITEGLTPGDRVVIDDIAPAIPGMALTPIEAAQ